MSIEAMKQALEALENHVECFDSEQYTSICELEPAKEAITSLRTAIAEAEKQEPVAWYHAEDFKTHFTTGPSEELVKSGYWQPLYKEAAL